MFRKVLIANRGEIAVRIIRACREMGMKTVAVYSEIDRNALHVRFADEAYFIGPAPAKESYLNIDKIMHAAAAARADAIHPGYGFLAENPALAEACDTAGITFIGPPAAAQRLMGEKTSSRRLLQQAGIPLVPGMVRGLQDEAEAFKMAEEIGYPVLIKAAAGGGGKGMRTVLNPEQLPDAYRAAKSEAASSFGDDSIYLEKLIEGARHIEIQLLGDYYGNVVHLGERECSIQRRNQKMIEECPSPALDDRLREAMGDLAVRIAKMVRYSNAGTAEFLFDKHGKYYFLEMNARLQVEHPVTEFVNGIDIVKEQFAVAAGQKLRLSQDRIFSKGWAIECRIYAEDPYNHFLPSLGIVRAIQEPSGPGVRVESGVFSGMVIPLHYDPLLSKLVVWGNTRREAIDRMRRALSEYYILGVKTTFPFHQFVMNNDSFIQGRYDTSFEEKEWREEAFEIEDLSSVAALAAAVVAHTRRKREANARCSETSGLSPWKSLGRQYALRRC
jgi:acetyl-CoA carboxylase biotin carboxylase subunit